jgi:hypothetical protein
MQTLVTALLAHVESTTAAPPPITSPKPPAPASKPTVFISYSHADEMWKDRLVKQLDVLKGIGVLEPWDDRKIGAGLDWKPEIERAMDRAAVAVLLVSADFLTSDFIKNEEAPRLLARREAGGLRVIPVIVRPCPWSRIPWLSAMQARPKDARPLSGGPEYQIDADLAAIAEEIAGIIQGAG